MATMINSQKKLDYAKQTSEAFAKAKRDLVTTIEDLKSLGDNIKMAVTDKIYNNMAHIGSVTATAIDTYAKGLAEDVLAPLANGPAISGEALKQGAKKIIPDLEAIYNNKVDFVMIDQATIDGRGLEENWTDASRAKYGDICTKFISIRARLMSEIGDITVKCSESDMKEVYHKLGKKFEDICNSSVVVFNELTAQLETANILLAKDIEQATNAASRLDNVDDMGKADNVIGDDNL